MMADKLLKGETWLIWLVLAICGCEPTPIEDYRLSEMTDSLPPRHSQNIDEQLRRLFGTPDFPQLLIPAQDAEAGEDDETIFVHAVDPRQLQRGAQVFRNRCAGCHGITGDGEGEAAPYLRPKPRDFRRGIFKFTSTPYGAKPARQDLVRVIRRGAKGTSMPSFRWMSDEDLNSVIDYVILLSQRGEVEGLVAELAESDYGEDEDIDPSEFETALVDVRDSWQQAESEIVVPDSAQPAYAMDSIRKGRELFISENCWKCHGENAKGQTEWLSHEFLAKQEALPPEDRIAINYDAWNEPAPAADITARLLHGGRRDIDIYRRIHTGISGTPMPAFGQLYQDDPDTIWHLVHYIRHIIEGGDPQVP